MNQNDRDANVKETSNKPQMVSTSGGTDSDTLPVTPQKANSWWRFPLVLFSAMISGGVVLLVFNAFFESLLQSAIAASLPLTTIFAILTLMLGLSTGYTLYNVTMLMKRVTESVKRIETYTDDTISKLRLTITKDVESTSERTNSVITGIQKEVNDVIRKLEVKIDHLQDIEVYYIQNKDENDLGYKKSLEVIARATSRIWIIGDFSPDWQPLHTTGERSEYLKAIEDVIKSHTTNDTTFEYRRVVQRDQNVIDNMTRAGQEIFLQADDMRGDEQAYEHCYRVSRLKQQASNSRVSVSLRVSRPIPSSPSILLVDNKYMLFTIPEKTRHNDGEHGYGLKSAGVLYFEDKRGGDSLIKKFEKLYHTMYMDASEVYRVQEPPIRLIG